MNQTLPPPPHLAVGVREKRQKWNTYNASSRKGAISQNGPLFRTFLLRIPYLSPFRIPQGRIRLRWVKGWTKMARKLPDLNSNAPFGSLPRKPTFGTDDNGTEVYRGHSLGHFGPTPPAPAEAGRGGFQEETDTEHRRGKLKKGANFGKRSPFSNFPRRCSLSVFLEPAMASCDRG